MASKDFLTKLFFSFFLCGAFLCFAPQTAKAQEGTDIFDRLMKPMPEFEQELSDEDFFKMTKPYQDIPYGNDDLGYSIRIPKNWEKGDVRGSGNFILSERLFLELASFYGKPTIIGRSKVEIQALNFEDNLTAIQWYIKYLLEGGFTTEGLVEHSDTKVEALSITYDDQQNPFYLRTLMHINGEKIILVRVHIPLKRMKKMGALQAKILESFKLKSIAKPKEILTGSYRFLDVIEMEYPEQWESVSKPIRSANRMHASFVNTKEVRVTQQVAPGVRKQSMEKMTEGTLDVHLISRTEGTLLEEVDKFKKDFEKKGIIIGDKIKNDTKYNYDSKIDFAITEVYHGSGGSSNVNDYEVWFTVMTAGNYYYFLTLLSPSRNDQFTTWAHNIKGYEYVLEHFVPSSGAFLVVE